MTMWIIPRYQTFHTLRPTRPDCGDMSLWSLALTSQLMKLRLTDGLMLASSNTIDGQQSVESGHSVAIKFCNVMSYALVACSLGRM
jgi:hypothetical protein